MTSTLELEGSNYESDESNETIDKLSGNHGWANVMSKILHTKKPKRKKNIILSKAKKLCDVQTTPTEQLLSFEIKREDGEIKCTDTVEKCKNQDNVKTVLNKKHKRKELGLGIRIKPSVLDRERERLLQKIATKGVVQLFNAVKQQQMEIDTKLEKAGPLDRKRTEVLKSIDKNIFLDTLMGGTKSIQVDESVQVVKKYEDEEKNGNKLWNVLRDDFVMSSSMKDWDKQDTESEKSNPEEDDNSDG